MKAFQLTQFRVIGGVVLSTDISMSSMNHTENGLLLMLVAEHGGVEESSGGAEAV